MLPLALYGTIRTTLTPFSIPPPHYFSSSCFSLALSILRRERTKLSPFPIVLCCDCFGLPPFHGRFSFSQLSYLLSGFQVSSLTLITSLSPNLRVLRLLVTDSALSSSIRSSVSCARNPCSLFQSCSPRGTVFHRQSPLDRGLLPELHRRLASHSRATFYPLSTRFRP
jgi:hypothetical protein